MAKSLSKLGNRFPKLAEVVLLVAIGHNRIRVTVNVAVQLSSAQQKNSFLLVCQPSNSQMGPSKVQGGNVMRRIVFRSILDEDKNVTRFSAKRERKERQLTCLLADVRFTIVLCHRYASLSVHSKFQSFDSGDTKLLRRAKLIKTSHIQVAGFLLLRGTKTITAQPEMTVKLPEASIIKSCN